MKTVMEKSGEKKGRLPLLCTIKLDWDIASLNKLLRMRARSGKPIPMSSMVKTWKGRLHVAQLEQLGPDWMKLIGVSEPHPVRRLEIVRRCRRKMDTDNVYGGAKVLVDALKSYNEIVSGISIGRSAGWFYDDSPDYLDLQISQLLTGEKAWLELMLFGESQG